VTARDKQGYYRYCSLRAVFFLWPGTFCRMNPCNNRVHCCSSKAKSTIPSSPIRIASYESVNNNDLRQEICLFLSPWPWKLRSEFSARTLKTRKTRHGTSSFFNFWMKSSIERTWNLPVVASTSMSRWSAYTVLWSRGINYSTSSRTSWTEFQ